MALIRVFASFDIDRDADLLPRLVDEGKGRKSKFVVFDRSFKESETDESAQSLRDRISHVDALVVLCGEWTHAAENVNRELKLAQELGKRYYLIKGRNRIDCARPSTARIDDRMYIWTRRAINELVRRFR